MCSLTNARTVVTLAVCLLLGSPTAAQTVSDTTGAINGRITDATGGALASVNITISSDALIAGRRTTTGRDGFYQFSSLPPGDYTIVFALNGFTTLRCTGVHVGLGSTTTIDQALEVAAVRQSVTVDGSPVIDRHAVALSTRFDTDQLESLPGSRSMGALLAATPAVMVSRIDVGGSTGTPGSYGAYGTSGLNLPKIEGVHVTGILTVGFAFDFGSFEEASVGTGAHSAEWRDVGVQMSIVTKSGGNQFGLSLYADYEHHDWQAANVDNDQIGRVMQAGEGILLRQANRLSGYHDFNADAGGAVKRDKLWWYQSFRDQDISVRLVNFPVRPYRTHLTNYTGKATYQLTTGHKLTAFAQFSRDHQPDRLDPFGPIGGTLSATTATNDSDTTTDQRIRGVVWKADWNAFVGKALIFQALVGQFRTNRTDQPNGTSARFEDIGTLEVHGGNRDWQHTLERTQVTGSASLVTDGKLGNHVIKLGGEFLRHMWGEAWRRSYAGDVLHVVDQGAPREVYLFQTPSKAVIGLDFASAYFSDSWRVHPRLTVNAGMRWDRELIFFPAQSPPPSASDSPYPAVDDLIHWNAFVPRLGVIQDLKGDGRTILKLSFGQYSYPLGQEGAFNANPNSNVWWSRYGWSDRNGNGLWDSGEETGLLGRRGGAELEALDPDLDIPVTTEATMFVERELHSTIGLRTGVVWRREGDHFTRQSRDQSFNDFSVPVAIPDPGPNNSLGDADDGPPITAYNLRPEAREPGPSIVRTVPNSDTENWSWEVTATRQYRRGWSLVAGVAHTWHRDHANGYFGQAVRNNVYPVTPNDLINTSADGQYEFRTWSAKIHGTVDIPWGLRITPMLRHQSGQPFGRTFVARLNYGTVRMLAEPINARRMDNITIVDLRTEKEFSLGTSRRLSTFLDVFNLFNANPAQNTSWSSGTFLKPLNIVPPRVARIGVRLHW